MNSVVLFYSTSHAIKAEKYSNLNSLDAKLIPVPRHLSSSCGVCLSFNEEDRKLLIKVMGENNIEYESIECL